MVMVMITCMMRDGIRIEIVCRIDNDTFMMDIRVYLFPD